MEINLLGHCLICLDKAEDDKFIPSAPTNEPISRTTFANKVLPQLVLDKSTGKEKSMRDIFNQLVFGVLEEETEGKCEQVDNKAPSSPPPLCFSCLDQLSDLLKLLEELEVRTEEIRSKISGGGDGGAFESLLRGSEVVEEETKETTLELLECLREECCQQIIAEQDDDDNIDNQLEGSNGGTEGDEEYQVLIVNDEVDGAEEAIMKKYDDYEKIFEVRLRDDMIVNEVEVVEGSPQDSSNDGHLQNFNVRCADTDNDRVLESGPPKRFPCMEPSCNKSYTRRCNLRRHLGGAHKPANAPSQPHRCEYCGKGYNYSYNLKYHLKSKHLMTNYICEICGKGFVGNSHLKKHYSRHLGLKPFQCPNRELGCVKSFTDRGNLMSHLKRCQLILSKKK